MTARDDVEQLVARLSPNPVCDACIAERLGHSHRQHANMRAREIAGSNGFERRRDVCSLCYGEKLVTRRTSSV